MPYLRDREADDDALVVKLFAEVKRDELSAYGLAPERIENLVAMQFRAREKMYAQAFPAAEQQILCLDTGRAVGRHLLDRTGDVYRTVDLALLQEYRSQGLGTWLLRQAKERAAKDLCAHRLRVMRDSPASRLYFREGFSVIAEDELAWEMEWRS